MPKKRQRSLADPSVLSPRDEDDKRLFQVVVETPKGSRNKYAFDPDHRVFELKKVLPAGMAFPYDFGFLPSTKGGDGDPLDVLVLMDEPAFPGCVLKCRVIGVIEGEQGNKKKKNVTIGSLPLNAKTTAGPTLNKSVTLEANSAVSLKSFLLTITTFRMRNSGSSRSRGRTLPEN